MPVVVYKKCCICIGLRPGSLIIGYLNLIILICLAIISISTEMEQESRKHSVFKPQKISWIVVLSTYIVVAAIIISFLFTILLLVGIHANKRTLVKVYLIYLSAFTITYVVGFVTQLGSASMTMAVNDLGVVCVSLYYLMVIRSYYVVSEKEVHSNTEREISGEQTNFLTPDV